MEERKILQLGSDFNDLKSLILTLNKHFVMGDDFSHLKESLIFSMKPISNLNGKSNVIIELSDLKDPYFDAYLDF